jgi:subtilase family serine protease
VGGATINRASHRVAPQFTLSENNAPFYALGPEDFATQYDVAPVYAAGIDGTGQTIGILGEDNLNLALVDAYRKLFNLPADHTQIIIDGQDPGDGINPNVEGYLDVEMSGAIAPGATVNFYTAGAEAVSDPVWNPLTLAALRAVEDNQASVLSASFGECEQGLGEGGNQVWAGLWEQAAAQGQTVFVSSGDSGPTTCQPFAILTNGSLQFADSEQRAAGHAGGRNFRLFALHGPHYGPHRPEIWPPNMAARGRQTTLSTRWRGNIPVFFMTLPSAPTT